MPHCTRRNPTHASKLPDRMQSETHHRRLVPDARPDLVPLVTCVFGVLTSIFGSNGQLRWLERFARLSGECKQSVDEKRGHNAAQSHDHIMMAGEALSRDIR